MRLLDEALIKRFAEVGEQDIKDPIVVAHFYNPYGFGDWFATAFDPEERTIFGWAEVAPGCGEWGYTSVDELEFHPRVIRDFRWKEKRASEVEEIY